jgi:hypothetical protein
MKELGNSELYSNILSQLSDSPTLSSVISRLSFDDLSSKAAESDLAFAASHFDEMTAPLFDTLSLPLAEAILCAPGLRLTSEAFLYDLISGRFDDDADFFGLLERVHFEYLSPAAIGRFVERGSEFFDRLTPAIWESLCNRLGQPTRPAIGPSALREEEGSFYGIISGLTAACGGNVHDQGIVTVSSSSIVSGSHSNVVDFSTGDALSTGSESHPWICYDFRDRIVRPTGASVLFGADMPSPLQDDLVSFEISSDGSGWTGRDLSRSGVSPRNPRLCLLSLPPVFPEGRFARLRITNGSGNRALSVVAWEIFGRVGVASGGEVPSRPNGLPRPYGLDLDRAPPPYPLDLDRVPPHYALGLDLDRLGTGTGHIPEFGVCADGRPLPAELDGIAQFLNRAAERNVRAGFRILRRGYGFVHMTLALFMRRGVSPQRDGCFVDLHFRHHRIRVTHYALALRSDAERGECSWRFLSSMNGTDWTTVEQRHREQTADGSPSGVKTFELTAPTECSSARIEMLPGVVPHLTVRGFEVFGSILDGPGQ